MARNLTTHIARTIILCIVLSFVASSAALILQPEPAHANNHLQVTGNAANSSGSTANKTQIEAGKGAGQNPPPQLSALGKVGAVIGNMLLMIPALFAWLAGTLLDGVVTLLILNMGGLINQSTSIGFVVNELWRVVRDICNIAFIFGFVWIGIRTILDHESAGTKKMLASIIIGALLINFSLFFTKVIIDVSNVFAIEIYKQMGPTDGVGISAHFMEALGLITIYDSGGSAEVLANLSSGGAISFYVGAAVFLSVAAFVFAAGALLLVSRFVALILFMIFSPILFAATVFPKTQSYASDLWSKIISYAFFAPIYLLLLLMSLRLVQGSGNVIKGNGANFFKALNNEGGGDFFGVILFFVITIFFLTMSIRVANSFSIVGGQQAVSMGNNLRKSAQGGITGFAGRNTLGRLAEKVQKDFDREDAKGGGFARTLRFTGLDRSIRNFTEAGKTAKFGGSESRADVKKFAKDSGVRRAKIKPVLGLEQAVKDGDKKEIKRLAGMMSKAQLEEAGFAAINRTDVLGAISNQTMEDLAKSDEFNENQIAQLRTTRSAAVKDLFVRSGQVIAKDLVKASTAQLETLGEKFVTDNAHLLTTEQMKGLEKSKVYTEAQVADIKESRKGKVENLVRTPAGAQQVFQQFNGSGYENKKASEIASFPPNILTHSSSIPHITTGVLEQILDKKTLDPQQREAFGNILKASSTDPEVKKWLGSPKAARDWYGNA